MANCLADDCSRGIFEKAVSYKLTGNMVPLLDLIDGETIFDSAILKGWKKNEIYIDCGAYTGDTMIQFLEFCRGNYGKIILIDGDKNNCSWMRKLVKNVRLSNVEIYNELVWHKREELEFYTFDIKSDELIYENSDVSEWQKGNPCGMEKEELEKKSVYIAEKRIALSLDEIVLSEKNIGLIKICVVGSDMNVLKGCERIMKSQKPMIVVEWAGCKEQDVWDMIPFIKTVKSNYKIYLRQKKIWQSCKTILYAV